MGFGRHDQEHEEGRDVDTEKKGSVIVFGQWGETKGVETEKDIEEAKSRYEESESKLHAHPYVATAPDFRHSGQVVYLSRITNRDLGSYEEWDPLDEKQAKFSMTQEMISALGANPAKGEKLELLYNEAILYPIHEETLEAIHKNKAWQKISKAIAEKDESMRGIFAAEEVTIEDEQGNYSMRRTMGEGVKSFYDTLTKFNEYLEEKAPLLQEAARIETEITRRHQRKRAQKYDDAGKLLNALTVCALLYGEKVRRFRGKYKGYLMGASDTSGEASKSINTSLECIVESSYEVALRDLYDAPRMPYAGIRPFVNRLKKLNKDAGKRFDQWAREIVRGATEDTEEEQRVIKAWLDARGVTVVTTAQERAERRRQKQDKKAKDEEAAGQPLYYPFFYDHTIRNAFKAVANVHNLQGMANLQRKINRNTKVAVDVDKRIVTFRRKDAGGSSTLTRVDLSSVGDTLKAGGIVARLLLIAFAKVNKKYSTEDKGLVTDTIKIPMHEIMQMGYYKNERSVYNAAKKGIFKPLIKMTVYGERERRGKKLGATSQTLQESVLFTDWRLKDGVLTLWTNPRINWALLHEFVTYLPSYALSVPDKPMLMLVAICFSIRHNLEHLIKHGHTIISARAIQQALGLPDVKDCTNPTKQIKGVILKAIDTIEGIDASKRCLTITPHEPPEGATVQEWLDTTHFIIEPIGEYKAKFLEVARVNVEKEQKRIASAKRIKAKAKTLHEKEKLKAQEREQQLEASDRQRMKDAIARATQQTL